MLNCAFYLILIYCYIASSFQCTTAFPLFSIATHYYHPHPPPEICSVLIHLSGEYFGANIGANINGQKTSNAYV